MSGRMDVRASYGAFSLEVDITWDGQVLVLFGPSGCGKSTLIEATCGLRPDVTGTIYIGGQRLQGDGSWLQPDQRRVGWVPQDAALFPHLDVAHNIRFGRRSADVAMAERAIEVLELGPLLNRPIHALSGGERQRVAVARALASGARSLALDEPLAALDAPLRSRILSYFLRLRDELDICLLWVTHDPAEARALGGHMAVLGDGRVVAQGAPDRVFGRAPVLAILEELGCENVFEVQTGPGSDALVTVVTAGGQTLFMSSPAVGAGASFRIAVRAEDLLLSRARLVGTSARNQLEGQVIEIIEIDRTAWVRVRVRGEIWVARVTVAAIRELDLTAGTAVFLVLKASAIHQLLH